VGTVVHFESSPTFMFDNLTISTIHRFGYVVVGRCDAHSARWRTFRMPAYPIFGLLHADAGKTISSWLIISPLLGGEGLPCFKLSLGAASHCQPQTPPHSHERRNKRA
jgi:hypothetical protein